MRFVALMCLFLAGCHAAAPPATIKPSNSEVAARPQVSVRAGDEATVDDRAVMSAVLDGALRPDRDPRVGAGRATLPDLSALGGAVFLVLDLTVPSCSPEVMGLGNAILGCFDVRRDPEQRLLNELACEPDGRTVGVILERRNGRSLAIRGSLGENVVLVPADTVNKFAHVAELRHRYRADSAIVTLSAPIHPKAGVAVLFYRALNESSGFVCLVRHDNRWSVHTRKYVME